MLIFGEKLLRCVDQNMLSCLQKMQHAEIEDLKKETASGEIEDKLRIFLLESRCLFGVADSTKTLKSGQCFFQTKIGDKVQAFTGKVLVSRNPCYHPGDVRVLEAVYVCIYTFVYLFIYIRVPNLHTSKNVLYFL